MMMVMMVMMLLWTPACVGVVQDFYPAINSTHTLTCDCSDSACQDVFWFRLLPHSQSLQFLAFANSGGRVQRGEVTTRFNTSSAGVRVTSFSLHLLRLQEQDSALYACFLRASHALYGFRVSPGAEAPRVRPPVTTVTAVRTGRGCGCRPAVGVVGCEARVLWWGGGAVLALTLVLLATLFYFSRLPKKCRHQFLKTNQLR